MAVINQVYQVINLATQQAWGKNAVEIVDTQSLIAMGDYIINSSDVNSRDVFTKALTDIIGKTIFVSREYRGADLGLSRDEYEYGGIVRKIRVKPRLTQYNNEYNFTNENFNPWEISVPTVDEKLFSKFGTYSLTVTVTDNQIFTAFKSNEEMMSFYSLIYKQLNDCIKRGEEAYDRMALANFIGEKFKLQDSQANKKHTMNVLKKYNDTFGTDLKVKDIWTSPEFLRYFTSVVSEYKDYMAEDTDVFNGSDGYLSQTPEDYMNFYMLKAVDARLAAYLYSDTFHESMIHLNKYKTVSFWQGIGDSDSFNPDSTSKIHLNLASDGSVLEQGGILAVMMDKDAVATFYKRPNAETWRIPQIGNNVYKSVTQMMCNDMFENGIIFYVEDEEV